MARVHELTRTEARRIAISAQLLTARRPQGLLETLQGLTHVQLEPTSAVAPSADLVLWSRLGSAYDPQELRDALDEQRLIELWGTVRPADDIGLLRAEMAQWPGTGELAEWQEARAEWLDDNDGCRLDLLERLRADGPLPLRELPDTCERPWRSSGWNDNRNVTMLLHLLVQRGEVAVAGGEGRERLWDLAERVYPDVPVVPAAEARRLRAERRLRSLGLVRPGAGQDPVEPLDLRDVGEPAVIEGVRGRWRVDPERLGQPFEGRTALLSPFDRLLHDRKRMSEVFEFDYSLEMYKPAAQRRWGYYALPILYGDRLVGKLDAATDRRARPPAGRCAARGRAVHLGDARRRRRRDRRPGPVARRRATPLRDRRAHRGRARQPRSAGRARRRGRSAPARRGS
jgi:uncharacterized protein YcaQ